MRMIYLGSRAGIRQVGGARAGALLLQTFCSHSSWPAA